MVTSTFPPILKTTSSYTCLVGMHMLQYTVLPFGLATVSRLSLKYLALVVAYLCLQGCKTSLILMMAADGIFQRSIIKSFFPSFGDLPEAGSPSTLEKAPFNLIPKSTIYKGHAGFCSGNRVFCPLKKCKSFLL